ncbi:MAG: hypothetical protein HXX11_15740 [Desulfuromonadales bacterium]|nr:hypothetical protein [Desulfuromonadales bacterium]
MRRIIAVFMLQTFFCVSTSRAIVYRGAMDSRAGYPSLPGFTAQSNAWHGKGLRLEWIIDDETSPGYWTYSYRLVRSASMNKSFAFFDLETAPDFSAANVKQWGVTESYTTNSSGQTTMLDPVDYTTVVSIASQVSFSGPLNFNIVHDFSHAAVTESNTATALNKFDLSHYSGDPGRAAPGVYSSSASSTPSVGPVAHPFYGVRWIFPGTGFNYYVPCAWEVKIVADRAPMWGSFFGWGDQTSTSPNWYANFYNDNIDQATRPTARPESTVDASGAMLPLFATYQGWILTPGKLAPPVSNPITLTFAGTGGGSVSGSISCISTKTCNPVVFAQGSQLTLMATPDSNSLFKAWSGACTNTTGNCVITMPSTATGVTITFDEAAKVQIGTTPYTSLSSAFAAAAAGTVQARAIEFNEEPVINLPTTFVGGFNAPFTSNGGSLTTLTGSLTIGTGCLIVEGLSIR